LNREGKTAILAVSHLLIIVVIMNKAFTKENEDDDEPDDTPKLPQGVKNYITPAGHQRLKDEFDRSENGDYIYGKKRLREIDRRLRFLSKRLDNAEVVDPAQRGECDQVFFGATVTVCNSRGEEHTYSIVGMDEADPGRGRISWISPLAKALIKAYEGDIVKLHTPGGMEELEVVEIRYEAL